MNIKNAIKNYIERSWGIYIWKFTKKDFTKKDSYYSLEKFLKRFATNLTKKIRGPTKAKENYELCLKNKTSRTVKNDSDIKSVTVRHYKTALTFVTQVLETVKKPNISDIESAAIEHPKPATKLSKAIK